MVSFPATSRPTHGGNLVWAAQVAQCDPHGLLDFSASISPLGPPATVLTAMQEALGDLCHYPDPGYGALRTALAAHHGLAPEGVLPGNGAAELLTWAGRELATLEGTVVLTPAFADYGRSLAAFGGQPIPCPIPLTAALTGAVDWAALIPLQGAARRGLLLNSPHNPTGLLIPPQVIQGWVDAFGLVVVDEAFMDFLPPGQQRSLAQLATQRSNLVVLRSLTKFYSLPGLRLGYGISTPERWQRWQQWRDPWPVNTLAAVAAIAALADTPYQQTMAQWLPPARSALVAGLQAIPGLVPFPGTANYLLVRSDRGSVPALQRQLLTDHRILIRDCLSFPELGDRYFRIAVRTPADNQRLLTALAAIV